IWAEYYGTEQVLLWIGTRYTDLLELSTCNIVRMWATISSCYQISTRRGNPALFQGLRDETLEQLKMIQSGELTLPGIETDKSSLPSMHNYSLDPRYVVNSIRIANDGVSYNGTPNDKPRLPVFPLQ